MKSVTKMTPIRFSELSKSASPVLIAGAGGMLAWDLNRTFSDLVGQQSTIALSRAELDIANAQSVEDAFQKYQPKVVLNAAAYTQVDKAETERELTLAGNCTGPALLAEACRRRGIPFVHYSTDQVFDGSLGRPQREDDRPNPLNWYAGSKLEGEKKVLTYEQSLVFRVQWLYGEKKDRFSPLKQKEVFSPFADQYGAPTWTREIAIITAEMLAKKESGLFHLSYDDYASWADVFDFVKQTWKLPLRLEPQTTAKLNLPAKRPLFSVLSNAKLSSVLGRNLGSWKTPLAEFLQRVGAKS